MNTSSIKTDVVVNDEAHSATLLAGNNLAGRDTVLGTSSNDFIVPANTEATYLGLGGDDIYILSPHVIKANALIQIDDAVGVNVIQLADGLDIASTLFYEDQVDFIKDLNSGSVQRIVEGHGETFENFVFSPDGEYITYIGGGHLFITPNPYWLG